MRSNQIVSASVFLILVAAPGGCGKTGQDATTSTTTTTSTVRVSGVQLGRAYRMGQGISQPTQTFASNEPIYATVLTTGSGTGATLRTRWILDNGQVVREDTQTISSDVDPTAGVQIATPLGLAPGHYHLEVSVNGQPPSTTDFEVTSATGGAPAAVDTERIGTK